MRNNPALATALLIASTVLASAAPSPSRATRDSGGAEWGFNLANEDSSVRPGDNFFLFANGTYLKNLTIPSDRQSFGLLTARNAATQDRIFKLVEDAASGSSNDPVLQKIGTLYDAFNDESTIERLGESPIEPEIGRIRALKTKADMSQFMGDAQDHFGASLFFLHISPDDKDPSVYAINVHQPELGLPSREYYISNDFADKRAAYQEYIAHMLDLVRWPNAQEQALKVVAFETRVARASWSEAEQRDPNKTYNPMSRGQLRTALRGFDVSRFLKGAQLSPENRFIVDENTAISAIATIFVDTDLETLKAWEAFNVADNAANLLSTSFVDANFEFRGKVLAGQPDIAPRWRRALFVEDAILGEAVGHLYVDHYFTRSSKDQVDEMVRNIKDVFRKRIEHADWLTNETRIEALKKIDVMSVGIGYPEHWKSYDFEVLPFDLVGDVKRGRAWQSQYDHLKLRQPVDREAWNLNPQDLGSEYNAQLNRITFPAGALQTPFFGPAADSAVNYGGIGVVIGHELTHGFDDQGRKADSTGQLRNWWAQQDAHYFDTQAARLAQQYSSFEPIPGVHVNGQLTLGEDLADLGGVSLALEAYHKTLGGISAPQIEGTSGDQRFFLSCAQVWAGKMRDDAVRQQLTHDPHPPGEVRTNGEVRNVDAWYAAFDVKPGDKLYLDPQDRVHVW